MRMREGQWVKIHVRRFDSPDLEFVGKVSEVTEAHVIAETRQARKPGGEPMRWGMEWEHPGQPVLITPMTRQDWAARNRRKGAGFRL